MMGYDKERDRLSWTSTMAMGGGRQLPVECPHPVRRQRFMCLDRRGSELPQGLLG